MLLEMEDSNCVIFGLVCKIFTTNLAMGLLGLNPNNTTLEKSKA